MRLCEVCSCNIDHKRSDATCCSVKCKNASRRNNIKRICVSCGSEFIVRGGPQKTCGKSCQLIKNAAIKREFAKENPEKVKAWKRAERERNKGSYAERRKKWREDNSEKYKERMSRNYQKDPSARVAYTRQYRIDNPEQRREYYQRAKEKITATRKAWIENNQDRFEESRVRSCLKSKLGLEPDQELIDLAVIRRRVTRAIKKAGE